MYLTDIIKKYSERSQKLENVCLADFVSLFSKKKYTNNIECNEQDYRSREKSAIIKYRRYILAQDPLNYYREQILLFVPWRNEVQKIENINSENKYVEYLKLIIQNRSKYSILEDEEMDNALRAN